MAKVGSIQIGSEWKIRNPNIEARNKFKMGKRRNRQTKLLPRLALFPFSTFPNCFGFSTLRSLHALSPTGAFRRKAALRFTREAATEDGRISDFGFTSHPRPSVVKTQSLSVFLRSSVVNLPLSVFRVFAVGDWGSEAENEP